MSQLILPSDKRCLKMFDKNEKDPHLPCDQEDIYLNTIFDNEIMSSQSENKNEAFGFHCLLGVEGACIPLNLLLWFWDVKQYLREIMWYLCWSLFYLLFCLLVLQLQCVSWGLPHEKLLKSFEMIKILLSCCQDTAFAYFFSSMGMQNLWSHWSFQLSHSPQCCFSTLCVQDTLDYEIK